MTTALIVLGATVGLVNVVIVLALFRAGRERPGRDFLENPDHYGEHPLWPAGRGEDHE